MKVEGNVRYQHEGITERPMIQSGEPLRFELESFVASVANGTPPRVTGADGIRAVELADAVVERATASEGARTDADQVVTSNR